MVTDAMNKLTCVFYNLRMQIALLRVTLQDLRRGVMSGVIFVECLQCDHSRLSAYPWHGFLEKFWLRYILDVDVHLFDLHSNHLFDCGCHFFLYSSTNFDDIYARFHHKIQVGRDDVLLYSQSNAIPGKIAAQQAGPLVGRMSHTNNSRDLRCRVRDNG